MEARLKELEAASQDLFDQIDDRVSRMQAKVATLRGGIENVKRLMTMVTSEEQRTKPTCFYSLASYPISESFEVKLEPVEFKFSRFPARSQTGKVLLARLRDDRQNYEQITKQQIDFIEGPVRRQLEEATTKLFEINRSLSELRSVSSLLVHHTFESRLIERDDLPLQDSLASRSSIIDGRAKSSKNKRFFLDNQTNRLSGSNSEDFEPSAARSNLQQAADLGPAPDSILKYHQDSFIEPDMLENYTLMNFQDEEDDLLTSNLPDCLPNLSGVVKDVMKVQRVLNNLRPETSKPDTSNESARPEEGSSFGDVPQTNQPALVPTMLPPPPPPPPPPLPPPGPPFQPLDIVADSTSNRTSTPEKIPAQSNASNQQTPTPAQRPLASNEAPPEDTPKPVAASGRDALMAEIRSAASRPKKRSSERAAASMASSSNNSAQTANANLDAHKLPHELTQDTIKIGASGKINLEISSSDPRDSLLASIRQAAGKPAKKANVQKLAPKERLLEGKLERQKLTSRQQDDLSEVQSKNGKSASTGGGDLMSDLVSKLKARRDGISGQFQASALDENTNRVATPLDTVQHRVLTQVSSLIPQVSPETLKRRKQPNFNDSDAHDDASSNEDDDDYWNT